MALDSHGQDSQSTAPANHELSVEEEEVIKDSKTGLIVLGKELMIETGKRLNLVSDEVYAEKKKLRKRKMRFNLLGVKVERK